MGRRINERSAARAAEQNAVLGSLHLRQPKPRAYWETKLETLLAGIIAEPSRVYHWRMKWPWPPPIYHAGDLEVIEVHVFGSFARGAAGSGDLDLLLVIDTRGGPCPLPVTVGRAVFGQPRQVQVYVDQVESRTNRDKFTEHRLLWSQTASDLKANLAAIPIVAGAGRFARKTDTLPFPLTAFRGTLEDAEKLVDAIAAGRVKSTVIPLDAVVVNRDQWSHDQEHIAHVFLDRSGVKTREIALPVVQHVFDSTKEPLILHNLDRSYLHISDVAATIGNINTRDWRLNRMDTSTVVLVPHNSRNFQTAIWCLERGPHHEIFDKLRDVHLWCLTRGKQPVHVTQIRSSKFLYGIMERGSLLAYGTEGEALAAVKAWRKETRIQLDVVKASGSKLLAWVCQANWVRVNGHAVHNSRFVGEFLVLVREALAKPPCNFELPVLDFFDDRDPYSVTPTGIPGVHCIDRGGHIIHGRIKQRRTGSLIELVAPLQEELSADRAAEVLALEKRRIRAV
jgi:hypothetical protein